MKRDLIIIIGLLGVIITLLATLNSSGIIPKTNQKSLPITQVKIKGQIFKVEVASTNQDKAKGLSNRDYLEKDHGMLFIFNKPDKYQFWMKDTKIPLDIIWISQDKKIVDFYKNAQPEPNIPDSQLKRYIPSSEAMYVLELPAGTLDHYQINIGEIVELL